MQLAIFVYASCTYVIVYRALILPETVVCHFTALLRQGPSTLWVAREVDYVKMWSASEQASEREVAGDGFHKILPTTSYVALPEARAILTLRKRNL